jgi:hypothetical protein
MIGHHFLTNKVTSGLTGVMSGKIPTRLLPKMNVLVTPYISESETVMGNKWVDIHNDPDWQRYEKHVRENVVPNLKDSSIFISITPNDGKPDVKFAVELGFAIMYDKPIILAIPPGTKVPDRLVKVADRIVEIDMNDEDSRNRLMETIMEMRAEFGEQDGEHRHGEE